MLTAAAAQTGCFDLFDSYAEGGGQGGVGAGQAGGGGSEAGGGSGGEGGAGGGAGPTCPTSDFGFALSLSDAFLRARVGTVSTVTGEVTVVGELGDTFDFGDASLSVTSGLRPFFVAKVDRAGDPVTAHGIDLFESSQPSVRAVIATSDGGSAVLLRGFGVVVDGDAIPGQNDSAVDDALVVKLAADGTVAWSLLLEGGVTPITASLLKESGGRLLIGGSAETELLTRRRATELGGPVNHNGPIGLFLLEVDLEGVETRLRRWTGSGTIADVATRGSSEVVLGSFVGGFPNFLNAVDVPSDAPSGALFAVELDAAGDAAVLQRSYGFDSRGNQALGLLSSGDGLVLTGHTSGDASGGATFEGAPATTLAAGAHASFAAMLDANLDVQWVTTSPISDASTVTHSPGRAGDDVVLGHQLSSGSVALGGTSVALAPADDVAFARVAPSGELAGWALLGAAPDTARLELTRDGGPCGDLLVGTLDGDVTLFGDRYSGTDAGSGLIVFRGTGLAWQRP